MRSLAAVALWAGCVLASIVASSLCFELSGGAWTLAGMMASLAGALLLIVELAMPKGPIDSDVGPPPRRSRLTRRSMIKLPAFALIPTFWIVPVSLALRGAARRSPVPEVVIVLVGGAVIALIAWWGSAVLLRQRFLVRFGEPACATVTRLASKKISYAFTLPDGCTGVGSTARTGEDVQLGSKVMVLFDPADPTRNIATRSAYFESDGPALPIARDVSSAR